MSPIAALLDPAFGRLAAFEAEADWMHSVIHQLSNRVTLIGVEAA